MNNTDVKQLSFPFISYLVQLPPHAVNQSLHVKIMAISPGGSDGKFDPWVRKILWRREWQPTPVFLPGEFHGQRSLVNAIAKRWIQLSLFKAQPFEVLFRSPPVGNNFPATCNFLPFIWSFCQL